MEVEAENYEALLEALHKWHSFIEWPCKFEIKEIARTLPQNNALHKFCADIAENLNASGLDMRRVIKTEVDIPWDRDTVKRFIWKPVQKALLDHDETRKLKRDEIDTVQQVIGKMLAEKFGLNVEFPSA